MNRRCFTLAVVATVFGCGTNGAHEERGFSRPIELDALLPGVDEPGRAEALATELRRLDRSGNRAFLGLMARRWFPEAVAATTVPSSATESVFAALDTLDGAIAPSAAFRPALGSAVSANSARRDVVEALRRGDLATARERVLVDATSASPREAVESGALTGFVLLRAGDVGDAHAAFVTAAQDAESNGLTWHAARAWLLATGVAASNPTVHFEVPSDGVSTWLHALRSGIACALPDRGIHDPVFWERAVECRGADVWPNDVVRDLCRVHAVPIDDDQRAAETADVLILLCAASARADRLEYVPALRCAELAGGRARTQRARSWAALEQARALIALRRMTEARTVLAECLEVDDAVVRSEALACLGGLELAEERPERAAALLSRAVELSGKPIEFPARGQALANLGVALLSTQREDEGRARLREAAQRFTVDGDVEGLHLTLANEIELALALGRSADVERLVAMTRRLETTGIE